MTEHLTSPNFGELSEFAIDPTKVDKPWGYELLWALADQYCGKMLFVRAGESLSPPVPPREGRVVADPVRPGEDRGGRSGRQDAEYRGRRPRRRVPDPPGHGAPGDCALEDTTILEVSTPHLDDIVRLEDRYGRGRTPVTILRTLC